MQHCASHTVPAGFSHLRQMPTAELSGRMVTARLVSIRTVRLSQMEVFALRTSCGSVHGP